jgi:tetratricopeptide (TPR) repeat protein
MNAMRKILFVHKAPGLEYGLTRLSKALDVDTELAGDWPTGRQKLFGERYDLVLVDYDTLIKEGLDSFVLLDNILQKEQTPGLLLATRHLGEAQKFADTLASLRACLPFTSPDIDTARFQEQLRELLAEAPVTPASAAEEGAQRKQEAEEEATPSSQDPEDSPRKPPVIEVDVRLPRLSEGELRNVALPRLLYTLLVHRSTGVLTLSMSNVERRFSFGEGQFMNDTGLDMGLIKSLCGAFAWTEGHFSFEERQAVSGKPTALMPLIRSGIEEYVTPRRVMDSLMALMKSYPIATQLWKERKNTLSWPVLTAVLERCDGETTLEKVLSSLGAQINEAFIASYFAIETDLLFMRSEATAREVVVSYGPQVQYASQADDPDEQRKKSKAYRAAGSERLALKAELSQFYEKIQRSTPHQIFGVWEGCGRKVVQERFYIMVKEHHPDVYGGNVSPDIRSLAQRIFIAVKDANTELMKIESEQTVPQPPEPSAAPATPAAPTVSQATAATGSATTTTTTTTTPPRVASRTTHPSSPIGLGRQPSSLHPNPSSQVKAQDTQATQKSQEAHKEKFESLAARHENKLQESRREKLERLVSASQSGSGDGGQAGDGATGAGSAKALAGVPVAMTPGRGATPADPAKESFNEGYLKFRSQHFDEAFPSFKKAYELDKTNGLYITFYAYTLYLTDKSKLSEAQKLLDEAVKTGHRQALPDAHLFMGFLLKAQGQDQKAHRNFEMALSLNPASVEAKREIRLYEMRHKDSPLSESVGFLKNIFKK